MGNKNYEAGRRYEYKAIEVLEGAGYEATRTAGSHGIFDVIACGPNVRLIQIKSFEKGNSWQSDYKEAKESIEEMKELPGVSYEVWIWRKHKGWIKQETIK